MRVHEIIVARRAEVLTAWRQQAVHLPAPRSGPECLGKCPELVDTLAEWMRHESPAAEARMREVARGHAQLRFEQGTLLPELMAEYRLLRRIVLRHVIHEQEEMHRDLGMPADDLEDIVLLNFALDDALSDAVERYFELRQQQLLLLQERLRLALDSASIGTWELDVRSGLFTWDERCERIFGVQGRGQVAFTEFLQLVHEDDRGAVEELARAALRGTGRREYASEFRIVRPSDGATRWVSARGSAMFQGEGAARFFGVAIDITDAKVAEEARERFLSVLGHDLRAPLASITMSAEQLARSGQVAPRGRGAVARIARASDRASRMTRDLLDLARGRLGGFAVTAAPADVGAICRAVVDEALAANPQRRIAVAVEGDLQAVCDRDRIAQAVTNLVANAVVHGSDPITVTASGQQECLTVAVANAGAPIPDDERPWLFHPFRRGRRAAGRGLGLGLYIVAEVMKAHRGTVAVESDERATVFRLRWPRDPRAA